MNYEDRTAQNKASVQLGDLLIMVKGGVSEVSMDQFLVIQESNDAPSTFYDSPELRKGRYERYSVLRMSDSRQLSEFDFTEIIGVITAMEEAGYILKQIIPAKDLTIIRKV